ncbi:uncharacterized protein LOC142180878 [Nicotiana tabacum]|uniref:Uncharacterized protein LOC142180878 n=2 Tax=Nicotiana TaxID=4085 RepID=A0AC58UHW1_TOBAC|nr:PREDICTED: uncharacterized protein LOC104218349 [Nicotiana sylvestris]
MVLFDMQQQLTLRLTDTNTQQEFILTLVYAKCDYIERIELWDTLYALASDMTTPWIVGGDFNVIWDEEEKFGGLLVPINEVDDFRHCINSRNLIDLGFKGSIFTWWNGRAEEDCIFKRLDHVLDNMELQQLFPSVEVTHLSKIGSDHCPLLIKCDPNLITAKKQFRFLNFWTDHNTFQEVVKENWVDDLAANSQVTSFTIFNNKLKKRKRVLSRWSKDTYGDIFQKVASLEEFVLVHEDQFELSPTSMNRERLNKVKAELTRYLALEEQFWRQKAGMAWFKDGDRNTKFFHAQNQELLKQPTKEEVKQAVFSLNADSAGGPDGFTGKFFQQSWSIVGDDVLAMTKEFFNDKDLPKYITHTNLVLLPKKKDVITFSDLQPISLGNFINKVFSRVIHERITPLLPSLISVKQAGFVKGRSIAENILLTQEIIIDIRLRTKAGPNVVLKLDMTKAYDRLSWLFMTKVLRKMGFEERIIGIVFGIVSNN